MTTSPRKSYWKAINDDEGKEITSVALYPEYWWLAASHPIPYVSHSAAALPASFVLAGYPEGK
jgi:hypothetical protein